MTAEQTTIFGAGRTLVDGKPLTPRQQHAFDLVRRAPFGVAADEVGAGWHALKKRHDQDSRCAYCVQEGTGVLRSQALRALVTRRRVTGLYVCRNPEDALTQEGQFDASGFAPSSEATESEATDEYDPATSAWPEGF